MKLGPYQRTPKELKDQIGEARRNYNVGKQDLYERSVTAVENSTNLGLGLFFVCLLLMVWMIALYWPITIQKLYEAFGIYPVIVIFFVSYFAFFLVSRFILKPSDEELADSSSYIALFSACGPRARRGGLSAIFGVSHTVLLMAYLVIMQTK